MQIYYGSPAHIIYITVAVVVCALIFLLLRGKSQKIQKNVILVIMLLNVFQHLFKSFIYPQYDGLGFTALSTAYNMCAAIILISPIVFVLKFNLLRDFVFYVGSVAGIIAIVLPYWSIGADAFDLEFVRSFICHTMLFSTSILPLLLGLHRPSYKCFYKLAICFIGTLGIIMLNDVLCILIGIYPGVEGMSLGEALRAANPVWSFGPPESFSWISDVAKIFLPDSWVGENPAGRYVPVVWYLVPMYLGITAVSFPICVLCDFKNFRSDVSKLFTKKETY